MEEKKPREMVRCDGCGGFHFEDDCEVIVIKIIKGKQCEFKGLQPQVREVVRVVEKQQDVELDNPSQHITAENKKETPPADNQPPAKVRSIVPPAIASMMMGPDHPLHESHGAKETRRV